MKVTAGDVNEGSQLLNPPRVLKIGVDPGPELGEQA
jgi:hypothetical protein